MRTTYTPCVTRLAFATFGALLLTAPTRAHESSSPRYTNITVGGGQASVSASPATPTLKMTPKPLAAGAAPPVVVVAPAPTPPRASILPWLAALALGAAALAFRRRASAHRRADEENLALAAHELQSPLAAIESYLDLMASEAPGASTQARRWLEDLSRMRTTTTHLRRTITDILGMTRVEDGRMKLSARTVDLAALSRTCVAAYSAHAAERGVALTSAVPTGLSPALADPDRLRQVLDNLIGNALKFTPSGKSVTVAGREAGGEVTLEVRDEGVGVPAGRRAQLFSKFQRLGPAVDGTEGTGLGLYLSHRLTAAQGGRLDYEPAENGGSVFRVTLPAA